jgi:hypothetical protein
LRLLDVLSDKAGQVKGSESSDVLSLSDKARYGLAGFQMDFIILRSNDLTHINSSGFLS